MNDLIKSCTRALVKPEETADSLINKFKETHIPSFLVGSRAWGGFTPESDYDVVIPMQYKEESVEIFKKYGAEEAENVEDYDVEDKSAYLKFNGKEINLICLSPKQYDAWKEASEMMLFAPAKIKQDRKLRRFTFRTIVSMLTMMVDE